MTVDHGRFSQSGGRPWIVPELLQSEATAERLSQEALRLLKDRTRYEQMQGAFESIRAQLGTPGASRRAAEVVLAEMSSVTVFLRILSYLRAYRFRVITACLCAVGVAGMSGVYAWLVQPVLDGIFIAKDQVLLMVLPLVIVGAATFKGAFAYGQAYLMSYVGNRIVADIRQQLFSHFLRLSLTFHHRHSGGRLASRVINDVNEMVNAVPNVIKDLIQQGLTFLVLSSVRFIRIGKWPRCCF